MKPTFRGTTNRATNMTQKTGLGVKTQGQQRLQPAPAFAPSVSAASAATDQRKGFDMTSYIFYARVSTLQQGRSGLGLSAQRETVNRHIGKNGEIIADYQDILSGRADNRPELKRALDHARRAGATLIIAKLDRLSRNARFILELLDSDVDLVFCDMPQCSGATGRFLLTSMAAVAQLEAGLCSQRTVEALAAAKRRGVRLGNPDKGKALSTYLKANGNGAGVAGNVKAAKERAAPWRETVETMLTAGLTACGIAKELTAKGEKTSRGANWTTFAVSRLIRHLEIEIPA